MPSAAQVHLALLHFPIVLAILSVPYLIWGFVRRSQAIARTGLLLMMLAALFSIPTYLSGDPAGELLEHGGYGALIPRGMIHEHEEAAEAAFVLLLAGGAGALGAFFLSLRGHRLTRRAIGATLLLAIAASALVARAAHLGGLIRHDELRGSSSGVSGASTEHEVDED